MNKKEYISGQEYKAYTEEFTNIMLSTVKQIIGLADKYNMDRDDELESFADIFKVMQETSTFQYWSEE